MGFSASQPISSVQTLVHEKMIHGQCCRGNIDVFFDRFSILSACKNKNETLVEYFLKTEKVDPNMIYACDVEKKVSGNFYSNIQREIDEKNLGMFDRKPECEIGKTIYRCALIDACESDSLEIVKLLLQNGANANIVLNGTTPIYLAACKGNLEMVKLLLEYKSPIYKNSETKVFVDAKNKIVYYSCLEIACYQSFVDIVNLLLLNGAKPTYDCIMKTRNLDVLKLLVSNEANFNEECLTHFSTCYNPKLIEFLLQNGIKVPSKCLEEVCNRSSLDNLKVLLDNGVTPNEKCLLIACKRVNFEMIRMLLDKEAIPDENCLLEACKRSDSTMLKMLLESHIIPNETCLLQTCQDSNFEMTKMLLDKGTAPTSKTLNVLASMKKSEINDNITKLVVSYNILRQNTQHGEPIADSNITV